MWDENDIRIDLSKQPSNILQKIKKFSPKLIVGFLNPKYKKVSSILKKRNKVFTYQTFILISFIAYHFYFQTSALGNVENLPGRNSSFVGREYIFKQIDEYLSEEGIAILYGLPGIGKTQIAKEYSYRNYNKYTVIWWFDSTRPLKIQLIDFCCELVENKFSEGDVETIKKMNEQKLKMFLGKILKNITQDILIILDDANQNIEIYSIFKKYNSKHIKTLITTNKKINSDNQIKVAEFNKEETLELFRQKLGADKTDKFYKLSSVLGYYPIAITQACNFLKTNSSISVDSYIQIFNSKPGFIWQRQDEQNHDQSPYYIDQNKKFTQAMSLIIEAVRKESELSYKFLVLLSILSESDVYPNYFLDDWLKMQGIKNDLEKLNVMYTLTKYDIIEPRNGTANIVSDKKNKQYVIHLLLRKYILYSLSEKERNHYFNIALELISNKITSDTKFAVDELIKNPCLLYATNSIMKIAQKYGLISKEIVELKIKQLQFEISLNLNGKKVKHLIDDIGNSINTYDIRNKYKAIFYTNKSIYYALIKNNPRIALENALISLKLLKVTNATYDEYIRSNTNIAHYYISLGDCISAKKYLDNAIKIINTKKSSKYSELLYSYANLRYNINQEQYENAISDVKRAETIIAQYNQNDIYMMKFFINTFKSVLFTKLDKYEEAQKLALSTLVKAKRYFSNVPINISTTLQLVLHKCNFHLHNIVHTNEISGIINYFNSENIIHQNQIEFHILLGDFLAQNDKFAESISEYQYAEKLIKSYFISTQNNTYRHLLLKIIDVANSSNQKELVREYIELYITNFKSFGAPEKNE